MDLNREEIPSEFSDFLKDTLEKNPDINMEEFIKKYFDSLVET